ncbi:hypothetical protein RZN25_01980 [Bacillaceae bacterium S4-13-56]
MKLSKITKGVGTIVLSVSLLAPTTISAESSHPVEKSPSIEKFEKEKEKIISKQMKLYNSMDEDQAKGLSESGKEKFKQKIIDKREDSIEKKLEKLNEKYGWEKVKQPFQIMPLTYSSDMDMDGDLYVSHYDVHIDMMGDMYGLVH